MYNIYYLFIQLRLFNLWKEFKYLVTFGRETNHLDSNKEQELLKGRYLS